MLAQLLIISSVILFIFCLFKIIKFFIKIRYFSKLPGPPTNWLLSHEVSNFETFSKLIEFNFKWHGKHPKLCRFFMGPIPMISLAHPDTIKVIIGHKLPKPPEYKIMIGAWIGDGLLLSNGNRWYRHRKLITPAFNYSILSSFLNVYRDATNVMLQLWEETAAREGYVNVQEFIPYLSLDILLQCIGSLTTNCQVERDALQYIKDVHTITIISVLRYFWPPYRFDSYFYLTPNGRAYKAGCKRAQAYTRDLILKRKQQLINSNGNREFRDFLDILLTSNDEKGRRLTDQEICDEVDTFVFEGHDTSSSAMTWLLYYLALYPEYQEICREEVNRCFDVNRLTMKDLSNLEFLTMFIKETLRLKPPVFAILRQANREMDIDGHLLPSGTLIQINTLQLHRNTEFWPEPLKFDPWRFSKENLAKMTPYSYLPFSAGERNCIGQIFAMNELKVVSSIILKKFKLELHPSLIGVEIDMHKEIVLKPINPIKLTISNVNH